MLLKTNQSFRLIGIKSYKTKIVESYPIDLDLESKKTFSFEIRAQKIRDKLFEFYGISIREKITKYLNYHYQGAKSLEKEILSSNLLKDAILQDQERKHSKLLAKKYAREIICRRNYLVPRLIKPLTNLLYHFSFKKVNVKFETNLLKLEKKYQIVYLPTHRSHLDFLILPNLFLKYGVESPFFATSNHLNFFPLNLMLHYSSASFIRRKKMNTIYNLIMSSFSRYISRNGHSYILFIEGRRSKTGLTLKPKSGLLSQIIHAFLLEQKQAKPLAFVPIHLSYDYIHEMDFFLSDLVDEMNLKYENSLYWGFLKRELLKNQQKGGVLKRLWSVIKWFKKVSQKGSLTITQAEPIFLEDLLEEFNKDWKNLEIVSKDGIPSEWQRSLAKRLAHKTVVTFNKITPVSLTSLATTAIWMGENASLEYNKLLSYIRYLGRYLNAHPTHPNVNIEGLNKDALTKILFLNQDRRKKRRRMPKGFKKDLRKRQLAYLIPIEQLRSRLAINNIVHYFVVPNLIFKFLNNRKDYQMERHRLYQLFSKEFPNLNSEFHLATNSNSEEIRKNFDQCIKTLQVIDLIRCSKNNGLELICASQDSDFKFEIMKDRFSRNRSSK